MKKIFTLLLTLSALFSTVNAQTYTTTADGNWSSSSTWSGGLVPPNTINAGVTVNINHRIIYDQSNDLDIHGSMIITNDTLRFPNNGTNGTGKTIFVRATGYIQVTDGGIILPVFLTNGSNNGGNFIIEGG